MRWERLFADLEAEAAEMEARARDAEIAERTRAEIAAVRWLQRLRGATGTTVSLAMAGAGPLSGRVRYVGPDWVLVDVVGQDVLVPAAAVLGVTGLGTAAPPDVERVPLTWAAAWRTLSRDRAVVRVERTDGSVVSGRVDRVGADFVEVSGVLVPFTAVRAGYAPREW